MLPLLDDVLWHRQRRGALHPGPWRGQRDLREFLSSLLGPEAKVTEQYDYIVVGSGFGGSVSALRLSEKGYRVLVVEMGKR